MWSYVVWISSWSVQGCCRVHCSEVFSITDTHREEGFTFQFYGFCSLLIFFLSNFWVLVGMWTFGE